MNRVKSGFGSLPSKTQIRFLCTSVLDDPHPQSPFLSENLASFLDNCSDALSLRKLHACIFAHGLGNNIFLGCKLLNCYARFDLLSDSRWVFDRIVNGNLSLWDAILVGYFRAGQFDEVLRRYVYLRRWNIGLDSGTITFALKSYSRWVFDRIVNGNLSLWDAILVGYFRAGQFDEVLRRYVYLRRWNIGLDSGTITFALKSCIELGDLGFGRGIHWDALKSGGSSNGFVGSSLMGLYSRCGFVKDAAEVLDEITERDIVVYKLIITGYAQSGDQRACEAFGFARCMQRQGLHPNRVTLVSLLQAASQLEALKQGRSVHGYAIRRGIGGLDEVFKTRKSIHGYIIRAGIQLHLLAATALVDLYSKANKLIQSRELFDRMEKKDAISYDVMMTG
ncbi:pentatricopeptide repeat-containing protein At2g13600-like [Malus sylvestris]|uniref:pentatricopeptide repeat-containing protein At2g13600-like n=1 Tax=Malus sylvestris TaxID=3752 RepID=UPI0021AC8D42|nr:pentatricopeptide repeat-containing protein At2g13600-like [Malus sylvestris]